MNCIICKHGSRQPGLATVTLVRDAMTLVIRRVPADVCDTCGEEYIGEMIATELVRLADEAAEAGVQVDVRDYVAA